jgi:hypothetical protein
MNTIATPLPLDEGVGWQGSSARRSWRRGSVPGSRRSPIREPLLSVSRMPALRPARFCDTSPHANHLGSRPPCRSLSFRSASGCGALEMRVRFRILLAFLILPTGLSFNTRAGSADLTCCAQSPSPARLPSRRHGQSPAPRPPQNAADPTRPTMDQRLQTATEGRYRRSQTGIWLSRFGRGISNPEIPHTDSVVYQRALRRPQNRQRSKPVLARLMRT